MSTLSRQEYFSVLRERYQAATSKFDRSVIIVEAITNTGLHRKSVIRVLNTIPREEGLPRLGRKKKYTFACTEILKKLYRASEYLCADKLKMMIPVLIEQRDLGLSDSLKAEILAISPASIDRYLRSYRNLERRKRNSGTRPGSMIFKRLIPIKCLTLVSPACGYLQADTVAHCGGSMAGEFIWSLTITDEFSGWTENRAVFGKSSKNVFPGIQSIHESLPFEIISFNVDNGSEFLNGRLYEYFKAFAELKTIPFPMTRSRSYHKNDNSHVEQKNWTHVRQIFGYDRFESKDLLVVMNEIYFLQNQIQNFFIPQFKLKSKVRILSRIKKKYDAPATPYSRVLSDSRVQDSVKKALTEKYLKLNYFDLRARKEELLARFIHIHKDLRSRNEAGPQGSLLTASR